ncbi:hypothetical protein F4777DRAFT_310827 [Nemania sp. FL0916]|nr:hypothetical protein F4777DRAFT_310827 [Nemania sp. FL0916]
MRSQSALFLSLALATVGFAANPRLGQTSIKTTSAHRRGEPQTGDDLPDTDPSPSNLDKVETAFQDAIELTSYVLLFIDTDNDVFPHYFDPNDRAEIKRIFSLINNGDQGADMLGNILVQTTDSNGLCDGRTLSYLNNGESGAADPPYIVLCPEAFNKKAVTALNGKSPQDPDANDYYAGCTEDGGEIDQNVSYVMNTLGMTLLHEYMHYDAMIASSFGSIVDNPNGAAGYGPVNVYDNLDKSLARVNADSYAYYASQVLWTALCGLEFMAPRAGTDDADPTCGGSPCSE